MFAARTPANTSHSGYMKHIKRAPCVTTRPTR